ncbi:MAG: flagellar hook-length control protein FliK [Desulfuromonadales bacterium]|nr:flagellar hook-length control protein FliK [Desulfuromonadales bacterium]
MAITSDIQQQVFDLLSKASNLSFISAEQESVGSLGLTPGQRVTAEVLSILPDSRVQVRIGAEQFNLNLPVAVRQGQNLELTYVSSEPRSTFAIARQGVGAPPVSLSDASRLLGLLASNEQLVDPLVRSSLQSVVGMLRRSPGESGVLANLMDEALTYGDMRQGGASSSLKAELLVRPSRDVQGAAPPQAGTGVATAEQLRLAAFESNASQILQQIARTSRSVLVEAVNQPVVPLLLAPGQEVDAAVQGTLPGGRVFVKVAGATLELVLPRPVADGEILRLTVIASQPKPVFAVSRTAPDVTQGVLSEAGRWLSVLEHGEGGISSQQRFVLDRLATVLKSLPPDSPAFTAIMDEAITYRTIMDGGRARSTLEGMTTTVTQQATLQQGNGIVLGDDMARLLQALIKGNRLNLVETLNQQTQPAFFTAGQQLKGEVLAALGGGRFLVQVADQMLEFSMSKGMRTGDRVTLFFITNDPRQTFLMTRFGLPGDSRVSETGRWLSGFLGASSENVPARETLGILRILLAGTPADAAQVGATLQRGLRESGLFYESHLARWFGGEYSLEDILKEPQGRLSKLKQPGGSTMPGGAQVVEPPPADMKNSSLDAMEAAFRKAGSITVHDEVIDQNSRMVVRQQLESLQSGQVILQGELFAGQPFEWSVNERDARRNSTGVQERSWDTVLRVDLPHLGGITVKLTLDGFRVAIDLHAREISSVGVLESGRGGLEEQLQAAGLDPGEIGVRHDAA